MAHDGMRASVAVPGAIDRLVFDQFITTVLIPTLVPGQIVVLDNLSVHHSAAAEAAVAAVGCEVRGVVSAARLARPQPH